MSLILLDIFKVFRSFVIFFCTRLFPLNLINNLDLNFFFIFNNGESTGPNTSISLIFFKCFFISLAPSRLKECEFAEIIIAINLENGGSKFFSLNLSSFFKSSSELFFISSFNLTSSGDKV